MGNRSKIYQDLESTTQELFDQLYGSEEAFINRNHIDPIEQYLLKFDNNLGDVVQQANLAIRIGARIPPEQDPDLFLYNIFESYVTKNNTQIHQNLPSFYDTITMDKTQFFNFAKQHVNEQILRDNFRIYYDQRLLFVMQLTNL